MATVLQEIGKLCPKNLKVSYPSATIDFLSKCLPEAFGSHRHPSGFEVDIHRNLTSQGMNLVKR